LNSKSDPSPLTSKRERPPRISDLLVVHDETDELFLRHQELLLERQLPAATSALSAYRELIELHMRQEEELLLPIYARSNPSPRWPSVLFSGQHQRMRELLSSVAERVAALDGAALRSRDIIAVIEQERTYKHLVEHHDGAEREGFFPALERALREDEHAAITTRCLREWRSLCAALEQRRLP
jgi:hemerythrin-like domain-containing protein